MPTTLQVPAIGDVVGEGRFELLSSLGEGGMSVVYRACDRTTGAEVALKLLLPRYVGRPEREQRLINEAEYLRRLRGHPHIIELVDTGRLHDLDGWPWLATEILAGHVLDWVFVRGKLEIPRIVQIAQQVADALHSCHAAGVVHRDATPSNVFVLDDPGGTIKLFDFSHAGDLWAPKLAVGAPGRLTGLNDVPGTLGYMGPEQVQQDPADPRMDVFCFGVLLFELVTRQNPYAHIQDRGAYIKGQREGSLEPPRLDAWAHGAPEELAELVHDCTKRASEERPTMAEIIARLAAISPCAAASKPPTARADVPETTAQMDPLAAIHARRAIEFGAWGPPPAFARPPHLRPPLAPDVVAPAAVAPERPREPEPEPEPEPDVTASDSAEIPPLDGGPSRTRLLAAAALLLVVGALAYFAWPRDRTPDAEPHAPGDGADHHPEPATTSSPIDAEPEIEHEPSTQIEPVPELEPVPEIEPPPETEPEPEPEPKPIPERCDGVADQARQALASRNWRRALALSTDRACWSSQADRAALRVTAFSELGEWSKCVEAGAGFKNSKVVAKVDGCRIFASPKNAP